MAVNCFQLVLLVCRLVKSHWRKAEVMSSLLCWGILFLEEKMAKYLF